MQPDLQQIQEKLVRLTPEKLAEVEDFIDFLHQRENEQHLKAAYMHASEETFKNAWDNDEDAIYDNL